MSTDDIYSVELKDDDWVEIIVNEKLHSLELKYSQQPLPSDLNLSPSHLLSNKNDLVVIDHDQGIFVLHSNKSSYNRNQSSWTKISDIPDVVPFGDWSATISNDKIFLFILVPWDDDDEIALSNDGMPCCNL